MQPVLFSLEKASATYKDQVALSDIDLTIRRGERVAIMGRSGSGKTTLLGLLYAQRPEEIALIPQSAALVGTLSVFHNVYMGRLDIHSTLHNLRTLVWPAETDLRAVGEVVRAVELEDKLRAKAGELSGGQQQRTSIARALFNGRPVVLGDEPVSALDRVQGGRILELLKSRHETLILALHDARLALEHTDRIIVLSQGRIAVDRAASELRIEDLVLEFEGEL